MREKLLINKNWEFSKDGVGFESVDIPHTWNNLDGQDGGGDYYRGECTYKKILDVQSLNGKKVFLEFGAVNAVASVSINDKYVGEHRGGYSAFRFDITPFVNEGENTLTVKANNSAKLQVYPQVADFTFCGGIYRDVNLIYVEDTHFNLEHHGSDGVFITSQVEEECAVVDVKSLISGATSGANLVCEVKDSKNEIVAACTVPIEGEEVSTKLNIENPILWNGRKNPYLYLLDAKIEKEGVIVDEIIISFGIRSFRVDSEKGFFLNEESYPLRGVSRHQDREDKGWAISETDQSEDIELIKEIGANTIRLAHYQHNKFFHSLCDDAGMVVWAEIPFITKFSKEEAYVENTMTQMRELVLQNYNHPSICFWGVSNEVTIVGQGPELLENQKKLNALIKELDPNRLTTLANVGTVVWDSEQNNLTDVLAYNIYFGWYTQTYDYNGEWMDGFHKEQPNKALCISEYGAEANIALHSAEPKVKDYSEEYQAMYHEHLAKVISERPYLWSTYVWAMFDFASDIRDEGGVSGRNNKGLVTADRTVKKDAFYIYKAYWNQTEKFAHICSRRFYDRASENIDVKVYSNQSEVTLFVNNVEVATVSGKYVFKFQDVPLKAGVNVLKAVAGDCVDEIQINRTETENPDYVLIYDENDTEVVGEGVKNWFADIEVIQKELTFEEGYYSIKNTIGEILANPETRAIMEPLTAGSPELDLDGGMVQMVVDVPLETVLQLAGDRMPENANYILNEQLQKIKK